MQTFKYKLNKDLCGRPAVLLNWELEECLFTTNILLSETRVVNAGSLIGLLSAGLRAGDIVTFSVRTEEQVKKVKQKLNKFDFLEEI